MDAMSHLLIDSIWRSTQYLAGSTSNRVPFEIVYALKHALKDWDLTDAIITTSLLKSSDFLCERANNAPKAVAAMVGEPVPYDLVQIAFPEIFQHYPLFCTPLYHEIGHYIEDRHGYVARLVAGSKVDELWALLPDRSHFSCLDIAARRRIIRNHLTEYFCDLFSASYLGTSAGFYIGQLEVGQPVTESHPLIRSRLTVIEKFTSKSTDPIVDLLKRCAIDTDGNQRLRQRFLDVPVAHCFTDARPVDIANVEEMHGIFPAALAFIANGQPPASCTSTNHVDELTKLVNDLVEKSIRNFMIAKAWNEHLV
ncbi:hypothetical protein AB2N08_07135 [Massilia aurea]|uniref:hypothetical protein n=1 Tax=Massilia aurea TaxID=373040 RepID=UPI003462D0B8